MQHLAAAAPSKTPGRQRAQEIDRYVAARIRARRIELAGLGGRDKWSQSAVAAQIGVTFQQLHKYEIGVNRVSAGRLYDIASALGIEVSYFFEGMPGMGAPDALLAEVIELNENVLAIPDERVRGAVVNIARVLAKVEDDG